MRSTIQRTAILAILAVAGVAGGFAAVRWGPWKGDENPSHSSDATAPATGKPGLARAATRASGGRIATATMSGLVQRDGETIAARIVLRSVPAESEAEGAAARLAPVREVGPIVAEARAKTDGKFEVPQIAHGEYILDATADDGSRGRARIDWVAIDEHRQIIIDVWSGRETLHGRVTTLDGQPWHGDLRVILDWAGEPPYDAANPFVLRARTDDAGRFKIGGLSGGHVTAQAIEEGAACVPGPTARLPYLGEYVLIVPGESDGVAGIVADDEGGAPIAGAVVVASDMRVSSVFRRVTGEDGRFRIPLPDTRSEIEVSADGFLPASEYFGRGEKDARFHLTRPGTIRGRVTADDDGRPVAGLDVLVSWGRGGSPGRKASTDADGRYEIRGLPATEIAVYARGLGWISKGTERVRNEGWNPFTVSLVSGGSATADILVSRGARATGHVRDPAGRPVAGAKVSATPSAPYGDQVVPVGSQFGSEDATTGEDGSFSLGMLVPGVEYAFEVRAEGFPIADAGSRVADAASPIDLDVRLSAANWIDVRVVERGTHQPISGAEVSITAASGGLGSRSEHTWLTGADGTVRAGPVAAGKYLVEAESGNHPRAWQGNPSVEVREGAAAVTVELDPPVALEGRVVLSDGTPAAGASVNCDCDDGNVECQSESCDGDGRFRVEGLREGEHSLWIEFTAGNHRWRLEKTIAAGSPHVVLTLAEEPVKEEARTDGDSRRTWGVWVVDATRKPVPKAVLSVRDSDRARYITWSEVTDGRATLDPDRAEQGYILEVESPTTAGGTRLPLGIGWGVLPAGPGRVEIRMPLETPIDGTVLDADGAPVSGVLLEATPERVPEASPADHSREVVSHARTDANGAFRIGGVGPEKYRIDVSAPPGSVLADPVLVDGGTHGLVIRLHHGISPLVTVLDPDGRPVAGAIVSASLKPHEMSLEWPDSIVTVLNEGGLMRTGVSGTVHLDGLEAARTYDLYVGIPNGRKDILGLDTPAWSPADTIIRLPGTHGISGFVRDLAGQPVEGAYVKVEGPARFQDTTTTDAAGAFAMRGVPAGSVRVHVSPPGGNESDQPEPDAAAATVQAGTTGLSLVVRLGAEMRVRIAAWEAPEIENREAVLTREPVTDDSPDHTSTIDRHGAVQFQGLAPGATYTLWVAPGPDGRIIYMHGLRGGGPEVAVRLEPGQPVRGHVTLPPLAKRPRVQATGPGFSVWADVGPDGRYVFPGLPTGPCRIRATAELAKDEGEASVETKSGQVVDLEIQGK